MKTRLRQIERVADARKLLERLREAEYVQATAKLGEVEQALTGVRLALRTAADDQRGALLAGDRASALLAEATSEVAAWNLVELKRRRTECLEALHQKRNAWQTFRLERERCESVAKTLVTQIATQDRRHEQAVSDDRFAARQHWVAFRRSI